MTEKFLLIAECQLIGTELQKSFSNIKITDSGEH